MMGIGELYLAQEDGGLPTTLAAGSAPGESGVSVLSLRFRGDVHFSAHRDSISSGLCRQCALNAARLVELFGTRRHQGRWLSVLLGSTAVTMPKKASMPFSSRSIPVSWHSQPQRLRGLKRD
jgi:hypothetical protein